MSRYGFAVLSAIVALSSVSAWAGTSLDRINVFASGMDGYHTYRIPAIEVAPDGTILAFAEARKYNSNDPGLDNEVDLVCKRSTDGGRIWSPIQVIEHAGKHWSAANPATVVDRQTGKIWLLYVRCAPGRGIYKARPGARDSQIFARSSDDNGRTWSEPIDLTAASRDMNDPKWGMTVVGPGGMIQDSKGRLVAAAWRYAPFGVFAIFSEDHGRTWQRGQVLSGREANENQLVELSDGRLLMDFRSESEKTPRWLVESRDGGRTWGEPRLEGLAPTPVCCAIERYSLKSAGDDRDRILWTGPKGPDRNELMLRVSYDEGRTFATERLIGPGYAGYSDMAILKNKDVGVLWEREDCRLITFVRLPKELVNELGR
ncbi:MAG: sialidase family protein [Thermoguttaceae bacterium]